MKFSARSIMLLALAGACMLVTGQAQMEASYLEESSARVEESSAVIEESSAAIRGPVLQPYAQCGGKAGVCGQSGQGPCEDAVWADYECPCSYECQKSSEWYYQCVPKNETSLNGKPVLPAWGQCGGMSGICGQKGAGPCQDAAWSGYACPCSYTCTRSTQWYWQCIPNGNRRLLKAGQQA